MMVSSQTFSGEIMMEDSEPEVASTPKHLWVVGVLALFWNAMGAYDYTMTQTRNEGYLSQFPPEVLAFVDAMPMWAVTTWATAIWFSVIGTVLLLARRRHAVWVFLVSLIAMVLTTVHTYFISNGMEVMGDAFSLAFNTMIFVVAVGLYFYARAMQQKGILV